MKGLSPWDVQWIRAHVDELAPLLDADEPWRRRDVPVPESVLEAATRRRVIRKVERVRDGQSGPVWTYSLSRGARDALARYAPGEPARDAERARADGGGR